MMDIARHGIYQPEHFYFAEIMCILLAVMLTDVVLLDVFNSMGMPTSTTVSIIFELLGSALAAALYKIYVADGSFAANVALGIPAGEVDRERVMQALRAAQLGELVTGLAKGIDTHVGECGCRLSGGQRQRIGIARALYRQADVLFFDEATSALDSGTEEGINRSIAELSQHNRDLTIVVIAHRESSLEYCDRIITLDNNG